MEKKSNQSDNICRIHTVGFRAGEKFYLRLIMANIVIRVIDNNLKLKDYYSNILTIQLEKTLVLVVSLRMHFYGFHRLVQIN